MKELLRAIELEGWYQRARITARGYLELKGWRCWTRKRFLLAIRS